MSALGDYIHLSTKNYLEHGTKAITNGNNPYQIRANFLKQRTSSLREVSQQTLDTLRYRIANDSIAQEERDRDGTQYLFNQGLAAIHETIASTTSEENFNTLFKVSKGYQDGYNNSAAYKKILVKADRSLGSQKNRLKAISQDIRKLKEQIDKINETGWVSKERIQNLLDSYQKVENMINKVDISSLKDISIKDKIFLKDNTKIKSIIGQLQLAIDNFNIRTTQKLLAGDLGELLVLMASDESWNVANKAVNDMIEQKIVGDERTRAVIPAEFIARDLSDLDGITLNREEATYSLAPTQDKVDVQVTVNRENVFASVKAYQSFNPNEWNYGTRDFNNAHLQSPISLFYPLTFLNSMLIEDFGNHWINMHAARTPDLIPISWKQNADLILKQELAYEALVVGNPWKQGVTPADTFISIERSTGRVIACNSKDLLLNKFNYFIFEPNIEHMRIANKKSDKISDRIMNILVQTRQLKVKVSYQIGKLAEWY